MIGVDLGKGKSIIVLVAIKFFFIGYYWREGSTVVGDWV